MSRKRARRAALFAMAPAVLSALAGRTGSDRRSATPALSLTMIGADGTGRTTLMRQIAES